MAGKGGNRQQKQAAKAVRRRQAVAAKQQAERLATSLPGRVAAAAAAPIERCLRTADIDSAGIGQVILARTLPSGALACGIFLVDLLCLGVKDVYYREMAPSGLEEHIETLDGNDQPTVAIDPASAKRLILGAVSFAAECGIDPVKDYKTVVKLFDGIDAALGTESFTYGRNGKALYVPGPSDSMTKMREIERKLLKARGPDGWDAALASGVPGRERIGLDLLHREADDEEDGPIIEHEPLAGSPNG